MLAFLLAITLAPVAAEDLPLGPGAVRVHDCECQPESEGWLTEMGARPYAGFAFTPERKDWSEKSGLAFDVSNLGAERVELLLRLDDQAGTPLYAGARLEAGEQQTLYCSLRYTPARLGMRTLPAPSGMVAVQQFTVAPLQPARMAALELMLPARNRGARLRVTRLRLVDAPEPRQLSDRFGQTTLTDWPDKVRDEAELPLRSQAEERRLSEWQRLPERNRFGGWLTGPRRQATGFFHCERWDGRWWLVDPEGCLFFSFGLNCVGTFDHTIVSGREDLFRWLPPALAPVHRLREGATAALGCDFLRLNLERKFGPEWESEYRRQIMRRLPMWGFNTLGNWSSPELRDNGRLPYVVTLTPPEQHASIPGSFDYWGPIADPYDPAFRADLREALEGAASVRSDPWCLGYFVDNEQSWGEDGADDEQRLQLSLGLLTLEAARSPAKRAWRERLRDRYDDVETLNRAWGLRLHSWEEWEAPLRLKLPLTAAARADLEEELADLAERYFSTVADTVHEADPHHLYLGARLYWFTPAVLQAAARHCDVLSFNAYQRDLDGESWRWLDELPGPALVSEFHVGARDGRLFEPGNLGVPTRADRALGATRFLESVRRHPALVGCHWFQYADQPLTGRAWDGENGNIGLVDVTDTPDWELVAAWREAARRFYATFPTTGAGPRW